MSTMLKLTNEERIVSSINDAGQTIHHHANKLSWTFILQYICTESHHVVHLNLHRVVCQLYLSKAGKKMKFAIVQET